ncbi:hypothetical protein ACET3Z_017803 [Daucus carota]
MSSSSSRRIASACAMGNLQMEKSTNDLSFVCNTNNSKLKKGILVLSNAMAGNVGKFLYGPVGLHLPDGAVWLARYNRELKIIEGLEELIKQYNVKNFHLLVFKYYGGTEFVLEIFNQYAVEICYSPRGANLGGNVVCDNDSSLHYETTMDVTEYEKDKMHACFFLNAYTTFTAEYVLVIKDEHLIQTDWTMVLSRDACAELDLDAKIEWLEFGFKKFMWRIDLKWEDGNLFFDRQWNTFAKAGKLAVGDKLMLMRDKHWQIFEVAVFERDACALFNKFVDKRKGQPKWFKIMNWESAVIGDVEVPFLFAEQYSQKLKEDVNLFLPDGGKFHAYFSIEGNLLYGLKDLMMTYAVKEQYVMFFEFVGLSSFYVTIYNEEGEDLFNKLTDKLMLRTLLKGIEETEKLDGLNYGTAGHCNADDCTNEHKRKKFRADLLTDFEVDLLKSHVDQNGHGVFLPRYLTHIFRKWNKSTLINLVMKGKTWRVAVLRRNKTCRFGVGWNSFTLDNKLRIGQKLVFSFVEDNTFQVNIVS